ncbi:unnamed protein product [Protopolystoma xenopodis]|uniref:Uncharacterized protein n=1 Tax=Protopolystoma xenopodis TaxID=117903 RepID=A0A3S4ZHL8_9PLAT|nr:unnamed protein product [Protopolystoma xenopodis]
MEERLLRIVARSTPRRIVMCCRSIREDSLCVFRRVKRRQGEKASFLEIALFHWANFSFEAQSFFIHARHVQPRRPDLYFASSSCDRLRLNAR